MNENAEPIMSRENRGIHRELILVDVISIALGILLIVRPELSANIICRGIGIALIVWGIIRVISYLIQARHVVLGSFSLVHGALLIGFGIAFTARPDLLAAFLTIALGVMLAVGGVLKLQYAIELANLRVATWWVQILGAAILGALAAVSFINPFKVDAALMIFLGISFVINGVWDLISVVVLTVISRRLRKAAEERLVDEERREDAVEASFLPDDEP